MGGAIGPAGQDYLVVVGNLLWNGTQASTFCGSGISFAGMVQVDNAQEPHDYIAQNIVNASVDGGNCASGGGGSGGETDGEGIILDSLNLSNYTSVYHH